MNTNNICYIKRLHLFIIISSVTIILFMSSSSYYDLSFAQKDKEDNDNAETDDGDKLVVKTRIQINNLDLENIKFI